MSDGTSSKATPPLTLALGSKLEPLLFFFNVVVGFDTAVVSDSLTVCSKQWSYLYVFHPQHTYSRLPSAHRYHAQLDRV